MHVSLLKIVAPLLSGGASAVLAGSEGMLLWFLIGFGIMVVLLQAVPALFVFVSILKGLFSSDPAEARFSPFRGKHTL